MISIDVSPEYGWVILGAGIGSVITNFYLGGMVMTARKEHNVELPNLYAVPGFHKNADAFNRVQRGHQNYLENIGGYAILTLIGGLKHPVVCAVGSVCFTAGSILYMKGYADTELDVTTARYKKGAAIKWLGLLASLYSSGAMAYSLITA
jgi:glutathione S-transferase